MSIMDSMALYSTPRLRFAAARGRVALVVWRWSFFTPKALHPIAQGCSLERTTLGHDVVMVVYAEGVTESLCMVRV